MHVGLTKRVNVRRYHSQSQSQSCLVSIYFYTHKPIQAYTHKHEVHIFVSICSLLL